VQRAIHNREFTVSELCASLAVSHGVAGTGVPGAKIQSIWTLESGRVEFPTDCEYYFVEQSYMVIVLKHVSSNMQRRMYDNFKKPRR
jgi:hypothetical protein